MHSYPPQLILFFSITIIFFRYRQKFLRSWRHGLEIPTPFKRWLWSCSLLFSCAEYVLHFCWVKEMGCAGLGLGRELGGGEIANVDLGELCTLVLRTIGARLLIFQKTSITSMLHVWGTRYAKYLR